MRLLIGGGFYSGVISIRRNTVILCPIEAHFTDLAVKKKANPRTNRLETTSVELFTVRKTKTGNGPSCGPAQGSKRSSSILIMQNRTLIVKMFINITDPTNSRRITHEA